MKLILDEPDSEALREFVRRGPPGASCMLARVEVVRAVRDQGPEAVARARLAVASLKLVALDEGLLEAAARLPAPVRTLDAIHLAAARSLGAELSALVTYDDRMAAGGHELGLPVITPRT